MEEETEDKIKLIRANCSKDFKEKDEKQKKRFMKNLAGLDARIQELEREERRKASRLQRAKDAQTRAEDEVASPKKDLSELH